MKQTLDTPQDLYVAMRNAITEGRAKTFQQIFLEGAWMWLGTPVPEVPSGLPEKMTDEEKSLISEIISIWRRGKKFRDYISAYIIGIKAKFPD